MQAFGHGGKRRGAGSRAEIPNSRRARVSWHRMIERCRNPNHPHYANYGGRGLVICERWFKFENFFADMGERPKGLSLERVNNAEGYHPGNCKWASAREQQNNRRKNVYLELNGQRRTLAQWTREKGWNRNLIVTRLRRGWSVERILTEPPKALRSEGGQFG